ncbi:uncharacterized protein LOC123665361 [Melitaea cinxia]|uniref:uncharacterized protein LOC123665361 n=1 Tax=Melitaea cinxia TaxID=113334 RepID=UPI001E272E85|nr:uncharacterized protein LOC123665361 [Melitaea cinxia]
MTNKKELFYDKLREFVETSTDRSFIMTTEKVKRANVTCKLCFRKNSINVERECAKLGLQEQANKRVSLSNLKFPCVEIGTNVLVGVPEVDRGRAAPRNVMCVVMSINPLGLYQLGNKEGKLDRLYARNEFTLSETNFINICDVPSTSSLTLRSASMLSFGSKQGFIMCHCKRYCIDKKCTCRSKNIKCNSKCHSNSSRKNK